MKRRRSRVDWYLPLPGSAEYERGYDASPPSPPKGGMSIAESGSSRLPANVVCLADYRASQIGKAL